MLLCNLRIHCHIHRILSLDPVLSQFNPGHIFMTYLILSFHKNVIGCGLDSFDSVQDQWQAVMNIVLNHQAP
jgi:hypothetical protein